MQDLDYISDSFSVLHLKPSKTWVFWTQAKCEVALSNWRTLFKNTADSPLVFKQYYSFKSWKKEATIFLSLLCSANIQKERPIDNNFS